MDAGASLKFNPRVHPHPHQQYAGADAGLEFYTRVKPAPAPYLNPGPDNILVQLIYQNINTYM